MRKSPISVARDTKAIPPRRTVERSAELHGDWASEDTVPVRVAAERVEAVEQTERLRLVTGRRRSSLWHRPRER
jgi:hypothetical protein